MIGRFARFVFIWSVLIISSNFIARIHFRFRFVSTPVACSAASPWPAADAKCDHSRDYSDQRLQQSEKPVPFNSRLAIERFFFCFFLHFPVNLNLALSLRWFCLADRALKVSCPIFASSVGFKWEIVLIAQANHCSQPDAIASLDLDERWQKTNDNYRFTFLYANEWISDYLFVRRNVNWKRPTRFASEPERDCWFWSACNMAPQPAAIARAHNGLVSFLAFYSFAFRHDDLAIFPLKRTLPGPIVAIGIRSQSETEDKHFYCLCLPKNRP